MPLSKSLENEPFSCSECRSRKGDDFAIWAYRQRLIHGRKLVVGFCDSKWWVHVVDFVLADNFIDQF